MEKQCVEKKLWGISCLIVHQASCSDDQSVNCFTVITAQETGSPVGVNKKHALVLIISLRSCGLCQYLGFSSNV